LHAVHTGNPLSRRASQANLMILSHWFMIRAGRTDRLRFWRSYWKARYKDLRESPADLARDLERRSWKSTRRLWEARDRRFWGLNRSYEPICSTGARGYIVRDFDRETLMALFADPEEPFRRPGVKLLKDSPSSTVAEFEFLSNGTPQQVIYKRFRVTAWKDPWVALVRRSPALRSWMYGHGLRERDLATARPLAVLHRRRFGFSFDGFLLTEKIAGAMELHRFVLSLEKLPPAERQTALRQRTEQAARLVRELHRRHLSHRDLKAANILVVKASQHPLGTIHSPPATNSLTDAPVWLVDLVGVSRHRKLTRQRRVQNLARLNASFHRAPALTRTDKLRFLRVYLQWGLFGKTGWKVWWRDIDQATQAKVARNVRKGRPLG
jgi:hypothetical protein